METLSAVLQGLTGYSSPIYLIVVLLCVSHLVLPLLASLRSGSPLPQKTSKHISFSHDWSYHLNWLALIPATIMLIWVFHGKANHFPHGILEDYKFGLNEWFNESMSSVYVPVICLTIASAISFLIYRKNRGSYTKAQKTTWWFPNPGGKPGVSTVVFHSMGTIVGSVVLVYVVHHLTICIDVYGLLRGWSNEAIRNMNKSDVVDEILWMKDYFASFIYPLAPAVLLCCINIVVRRVNLKARLADPVVMLTITAMTVLLVLLYYVPAAATGLVSSMNRAETIHELSNIPIFPMHFVFWGTTVGPIWTGMLAALGAGIFRKTK